MFEKWSEFFSMIGGSSIGLIGLLFIVVTLSAASEAANQRGDLSRGHSVYVSPTVFHLGIVFVISTTALAPDLPAILRGIAFFICAVAGLFYVKWVIRQFKSDRRPPGFERLDLWLYGMVPGIVYVGLLIVGVFVALRLRFAAHLLGLTTICLLLIAINNAWDLASWLAHPVRKQKRRLRETSDDAQATAKSTEAQTLSRPVGP